MIRGERERLPNRRARTLRQKTRVGNVNVYIETARFEDGRIGEVFVTLEQVEGAGFRCLMNDLAMVLSVALQYGVPLPVLVRSLKSSQFEPCGTTDDKRIPEAKSIVDYLARWLELEDERR